MSASITDKFVSPVSTVGLRPTPTTVSTVRSSSGTTLACADLTGWPDSTDCAVHFITYQVDGQGNVVAGTQTDWKGIVSGNNINNLTVYGGTDNGNLVGDIVEALPTAGWGKDLTDALRVAHNQDGTIKDNAVTEDNIADGDITARKLATSSIYLGHTELTSNQTTTSSTPVALSTLSRTVTVPAGGRKIKVKVHLPSLRNNNSSGGTTVSIWDGAVGSGTKLTEGTMTLTGTASTEMPVMVETPPLTVASGSKTYSIGWQTNGTGTSAVRASATQIAFISVELA